MAAVGVDPGGDLSGVEAEQVAPLDERDAPLGDEAADVADVDAEAVGQRGDVEQSGSWSRCSVCGVVVVMVASGDVDLVPN